MLKFWIHSVLMEETGGDTVGGGGGSTAIADTSGSTDLATTGNTSVATSGYGSGDTAGADAVAVGGFRAFENGKMTKATSAGLQALRTSHPEYTALARHAANALGFQNRVFSMGLGPNPIKTITNLQNFATAVGGPKGLEAYRAQSTDIDEQDALYAAGDPKLLQRMTHTQKADGSWAPNPPAVAAFVKLIPHALDMLANFSPNRYWRTISRPIVDHMKTLILTPDQKHPEVTEDLDLPYRVKRIGQALASVPAEGGPLSAEMRSVIMEELGAVTGFLNYLQELTKLEPEDLAPKVDPDAERREIDRERKQNTIDKMLVARGELLNVPYRAAWRNLNITTRATPAQQETIESLFKTDIDIARRNIPDYRATLDRFIDSNDHAGYVKLHKTFFDTKVPAILTKIVGKVLTKAPAKTSETTSATTSATVQPGAKATPAAGVKKVDGTPETNDMKRGPGGTTFQMHKEHQFIASKGNRWKLPEGTRCAW